jgi:hypothetical protein
MPNRILLSNTLFNCDMFTGVVTVFLFFKLDPVHVSTT